MIGDINLDLNLDLDNSQFNKSMLSTKAGMSLATLVVQTGTHVGTMHAARTTLMARKPLYTIRFKKDSQNSHEKSQGNAYLIENGGKFISENDDIDNITKEIRSCTSRIFANA